MLIDPTQINEQSQAGNAGQVALVFPAQTGIRKKCASSSACFGERIERK
jgi:hypothetical protein